LSTYFLFVETICRSISLLILQHHWPTLVIDLKFRLGEACSHIGALLFLIAEQVASGKNLPDDLSATDQLCAWKDPKSKCNLAFFLLFLNFRHSVERGTTLSKQKIYGKPQVSFLIV
jgi:hypothetical protein